MEILRQRSNSNLTDSSVSPAGSLGNDSPHLPSTPITPTSFLPQQGYYDDDDDDWDDWDDSSTVVEDDDPSHRRSGGSGGGGGPNKTKRRT